MGFVLGDIGRHEDARAITRRAIQLNPTLSRAHANLVDRPAARVRARDTGATRQARAAGQRARGQLAHYNLGLAFRSKGYYAEALREYQIALERGEERDLVLQAMAEVHLLMRQPRRRARALRRICSSAQPHESQALERARRRAASGRSVRRGRSRAIAARSTPSRRTRSRTTTSASRSIIAARSTRR